MMGNFTTKIWILGTWLSSCVQPDSNQTMWGTIKTSISLWWLAKNLVILFGMNLKWLWPCLHTIYPVPSNWMVYITCFGGIGLFQSHQHSLCQSHSTTGTKCFRTMIPSGVSMPLEVLNLTSVLPSSIHTPVFVNSTKVYPDWSRSLDENIMKSSATSYQQSPMLSPKTVWLPYAHWWTFNILCRHLKFSIRY